MFNPYIVPICFNFINWIKDNLFEPLISVIVDAFLVIFIAAVKVIMSLILSVFADVFYTIYVYILKIVDMFQNLFDLLSGANTIHYTYAGTTKSGYLTEVLMQIPTVKRAFYMVWGLSLILCVIFSLVAIGRSMGNLKGDGPQVNDVLRSLASSLVLFLAIQVVTVGTAMLSNVITTSVQTGINYSMGKSDLYVSDYIFVSSAVNALKTDHPNEDILDFFTSVGSSSPSDGAFEKLKEIFITQTNYADSDAVDDNLYVYRIDYVSGVIICIFVLRFFVGAALVFIQRIIMVMVGFISAPIFVAMIPIDGGERFNRWKDFYIGACFSSVSVIVIVRVYMMLLPMFADSSLIQMTGSTAVLAYFLRIYGIVILSMAFGKSTTVFNQILSDANVGTPDAMFENLTSFFPSGDDSNGNGNSGGGNGGGDGNNNGSGGGNNGGNAQGGGSSSGGSK